MTKKYIIPFTLDLQGKEIITVSLECLAAAPTAPEQARFYYDTEREQVGYYTGTEWRYVGGTTTASAITISEISGLDATTVQEALMELKQYYIDNPKADLVNGKIPASQLPSYVDDVLESDTFVGFPTIGEAGKIYVAVDTGRTYRWGGTAYAEISASLAIGTTSTTAFRGDYGQIAYAHALASGNPHNTGISDISGLQSALDSKALDAAVVHNSGTETVNGAKTFSAKISTSFAGEQLSFQSNSFIINSTNGGLKLQTSFTGKVIEFVNSGGTTTASIDLDAGLLTAERITLGGGTISAPSISINGNGGLYKVGSGIIGFTNGTNAFSWNGSALYPISHDAKDLGSSTSLAWKTLYIRDVTASGAITLNGSAAKQIVLGSTGSAFQVAGWNGSSNAILLHISNGLSGVSVGNIGLGGITSPTAKLHIGNISAGTDFFRMSDGNPGSTVFNIKRGESSSIDFSTFSGYVFNLQAATNVTGKLTASYFRISNCPTSSSGLSTGDIWNDSGTLKIV